MPCSCARLAATVLALASSTFLFAALPNEAFGQDSKWGVTFNFVPQWQTVQTLHEQLWDPAVEADGHELRIGVVRGSDLGGDWSVTFVRNTIKTARTFDGTFVSDFGAGPIVQGSIYTVPSNPEVYAVKFEKFTPFVTIQDRVQIGMTYGGGIGALRGSYNEQRFDVEIDFDPVTFMPLITQTVTSLEHEVKDLYLLDVVPIGSVEAAVAFIAAPGLKLRFSGGFNFPYTQVFSITANYLIGG